MGHQFPVAAESTNLYNTTAQVVTSLVPANGSINLLNAGDNFYLVLATNAVDIAPSNGTYSTYSQGTGMRVPNGSTFKFLQVKNTTSQNIVISIFIGFGGYIDNRLIVYNPLVSTVAYPTFPVANSGTSISIPDLSGNSFLDANNSVWYAVQRVGIYITNLDLASVYYLNDSSGMTKLLGVQPQTEILYQGSGNYQMNNGVANLNAIISESYLAVKPSLGLT